MENDKDGSVTNEEKLISVLGKQSDAAEALLQQPDLLFQVKKFLDQFHVGDDESKLLLFVGLIYSLKNRGGLSFAVKSSSSAGKTNLVTKVLDLLPASSIQKLDGSSEKGLIYSDNVEAPILFLREFAGVTETSTQVLKLSSWDGGFEYAVVEKNAQGKLEGKTRKISARAFVTTTTKLSLDEELENRCLSLSCDETVLQTRRIKTFIADSENSAFQNFGTTSKEDRQKTVIQSIAALLPEGKVFVPFAKDAVVLLPDELRIRRDATRLLLIIKASALLHFKQRPKIIAPNGDAAILALPADLAFAVRISGSAFAKSLSGLVGRMGDVFEACKAANGPISTASVAAATGIPTNTIRPALRELEKQGYLELDESESHSRKIIYRLASRQHLPDADRISAKKDLISLVKSQMEAYRQHQHREGYQYLNWDPESIPQTIIDPLTGRELNIIQVVGGMGGNADANNVQKTLDLRGKEDEANGQHSPNADAILTAETEV